jgi:hypothetical protein
MILWLICQRLFKNVSGFRKIAHLVMCPSKIGQYTLTKGIGRMVIRIAIGRTAQIAHGGRRLAGVQSIAALLDILCNLKGGAARGKSERREASNP